MALRSTPRAPRDRCHEPRALDINATSTRHELTPTCLLHRPLSVFTVSPLTTRRLATDCAVSPPQTAPSRRCPRCGAPAGRRKRDQHHRRPRFLPAARAAARPPVAGDRRPAPPQTAPRAQPVAFAFGERESDKTVVNQSRCPMVMPTCQLGWWKIN